MGAEAVLDDVGTGRTPFGINLAVGSVAMVAASFAAAVVSSDVSARLAVMALAVCVCAALVDDTRASLATAGLGYLLFTGFLVNRFGELTWDSATTLWTLLVFVLATGLGLGQRWIRAARAEAAVSAELDALLTKPISNEKESHGV